MAIIFHDVQFPPAIASGASGGPSFSTGIVSLPGGWEQRTGRWEHGQCKYSVDQSVKNRLQFNELLAFFRARRGKLYAFRFKDWTDFKADHEKIQAADGVTTTLQLKKTYTDDAGYTEERTITKPVKDTVHVYFGSEELTGVTVDYSTGAVTIPANVGLITGESLGNTDSTKTTFYVSSKPIKYGTNILTVYVDGIKVTDVSAYAYTLSSEDGSVVIRNNDGTALGNKTQVVGTTDDAVLSYNIGTIKNYVLGSITVKKAVSFFDDVAATYDQTTGLVTFDKLPGTSTGFEVNVTSSNNTIYSFPGAPDGKLYNVYLNGTKVDPSQYTVDYTANTITFASYPTGGQTLTIDFVLKGLQTTIAYKQVLPITVDYTSIADITASFEFDVPCRFDTDDMPASYEVFEQFNWTGINLVEVRIK